MWPGCYLRTPQTVLILLSAGTLWINSLLAQTPADSNSPSDGNSVEMAQPSPTPADPSTAAERVNIEEYYELLRLLTDTLDQIDRNYVKEISRRELIEAAIEGMLARLDAHSSYISPEELAQFKTEMESEFGGLGIRVSDDPLGVRVVNPLPNSPAARAGLQAGDLIVAIDGTSAAGLSSGQAVKRLKGRENTAVRLSIRRDGQQEPLEIEVKREVIRLETVIGCRRATDSAWDFWLDPSKKVAYVRITSFGRFTGEDLRATLTTLTRQEMKGLILDLRFNPGGLLSSAIEVSDLFLPDGRIVSTAGRNTEEQAWDAQKEGTFEGFDLVVLINGFSASASEIVAASLQDHHRATIVGERTWGKASVQNVIDLEGGRSALKLTTAGYKRPSGLNIQRFNNADPSQPWGVQPDPDHDVRLSGDETNQLYRQQLRIEVYGASDGGPRAEDAAVEPNFEDRQLARGLLSLTKRLDDR